MEPLAPVLVRLLGPGGLLSAPGPLSNSNKPHRIREQGRVSLCGGGGSPEPPEDQRGDEEEP